MLYHLGQYLAEFAGPFRLLTSFIFLAGLGAALGALSTWWLPPRWWHLLPTDRGRAFAVDADKSIGKPVSAGVLFIPLFVVISLLILKDMPPVRFRLDATPFLAAPAMVKAHVVSAVTAFFTGLTLLAGVKGNLMHRTLGYGWVVAMAAHKQQLR